MSRGKATDADHALAYARARRKRIDLQGLERAEVCDTLPGDDSSPDDWQTGYTPPKLAFDGACRVQEGLAQAEWCKPCLDRERFQGERIEARRLEDNAWRRFTRAAAKAAQRNEGERARH